MTLILSPSAVPHEGDEMTLECDAKIIEAIWSCRILLENPLRITLNPVKLLENPVELLQNPVELLENPVELLENPVE